MKYWRGSQVGPILALANSRSFTAAKIADEDLGGREGWINVLSRENLQGKPVGVSYCKIYMQAKEDPWSARGGSGGSSRRHTSPGKND